MTSSIVYEGQLRTSATHLQSQSKIETDAPTDNQGKGERFSPTDLVATGLGTCMITTMGIKAQSKNIDLTGVKVDVTKIMAPNPRRISGVDIAIHFPAGFTISDNDKVVLEQAALHCPVVKSLHPDLIVNTVFNW